MKAVPFAEVEAGCWNDACSSSRDAWLFHRAEWIGLEQSVFERPNRSFAIVDGTGQILAVTPLYLMVLGLGTWSERILVSGMPRMAGPALRDGLGAAQRREVHAAIMQRVQRDAESDDVDRVEFNAQTLAPGVRDAPLREVPWFVEKYGFQLGMQMSEMGVCPVPGMATCASDQVVFAGGDEDEQFAALDPACRRAVRKALKAGLATEVVTGADAAVAYRALAERSACRTGEALPPERYHRALMEDLGAQGRAVAIMVRQGSRYVAGVILVVDKGAASFAAGASDPDVLELRVNDLVHWEAIRWCRAQGHECYRLGPTFPGLPQDWPIAKVSRFKTKFGGRGLPVVQASWFRRPERYLDLGIVALRKLCMARAPSGQA